MLSKIADLKQREVVNIRDGKRLGPISDVEFDLETGKITALVIPGQSRLLRLFSLGRGAETIIPWQQIKKIGEDVILIESEERAGPT